MSFQRKSIARTIAFASGLLVVYLAATISPVVTYPPDLLGPGAITHSDDSQDIQMGAGLEAPSQLRQGPVIDPAGRP